MPFPLRPSPCLAVLLLAWLCSPLAIEAADSPPSSEQRFDSLLKESQATEANTPDRAVELAREALRLAASLPPAGAELRARNRLAEALRVANRYAEARTVIDAALALPAMATEAGDRALALYTSGQILWSRADYAAAEKIYIEVQRIAEAIGDRRLLIRALNSRGIVARHQNAPQQADAHFRAALALATDPGDATLRGQVLNNLAVLLTDERRLDEARALLQENLRLHTLADNRRGMANALVNLGAIEDAAGNPAAALDNYERSLALRRDRGAPRHIANSEYSVATALTKLGRADEALAHLQAAMPLAEQVGSHELWGNLYTAFSAAHAVRGEFREALAYREKADKENTLVAGEKTATTVAELRERFDAEKRSREIVELRSAQRLKDADLALKEAALRRTRLERYGLLALLALGGIAAAAVIGRQRAIARAERRILEETRRARDAAEQATALKSKLLDLASHDLKAPLVGVMMTADIIADETASQPEIAGHARAVRDESQRMFDLVQNLLDGSSLETGDLPLYRTPLDLGELLRELLPEFERRAARKNQRVVLVDAAPTPPISGDSTRLRQVVHNLVDNALKFSPAGSAAYLAVAPAGDHVRLSVRDEGPGLTAEDQRHLFQRFHRLSAAPTAGEPSTGLGLSLTHDLVAQHGGRLWAESTPGAGATFIAEFPAITTASA